MNLFLWINESMCGGRLEGEEEEEELEVERRWEWGLGGGEGVDLPWDISMLKRH